ncbi:MAG TPA: hypothetical protein VHM91_25555 [Verrucomicrobiales bacterium]|jgi:hypothetical protein|nr:hypothetical protein [Verrucomicrobiales bacterium]
MKIHRPLLAAALFTLASCDGEKVKEAEKKTGEAAKAIGEAAKEAGGTVLEKTKEGAKTVGEKTKAVLGVAKELIATKGGPAMENFKTKLGGISEWFKKSKGKEGDDPAKAQNAMAELMTKLKGVQTDGLPEDLKAAFQRYHGAMGQVQAITASVPVKKEEAEAWVMKNAEKLRSLEKLSMEAEKTLKETLAKHGITGLDLGGE